MRAYKEVIVEHLGMYVDYAQLDKIYAKPKQDEARYSPAECTGIKKKVILGRPEKSKISTSYVERNNLTMRMQMRRLTRLTNGFSKKWENLNYSLALHFVWYNFIRGHKALNGATPAMAANLTKTAWTLRDVLNVQTTQN